MVGLDARAAAEATGCGVAYIFMRGQLSVGTGVGTTARWGCVPDWRHRVCVHPSFCIDTSIDTIDGGTMPLGI